MEYLKNFKTYVALMVMSLAFAFASCDREGDNNDNSTKPVEATQWNYKLTVDVADGAEDQRAVMNTIVSLPNHNGEMQTKNLSLATEWSFTPSSCIGTLPAEGVITITQNVKEDVDLSTKEEYKVGIRYKLYIYSMNAEEGIVEYDIKESETFEVVPAENMTHLYPETTTLRYAVDAKGVVTIGGN